MKEYQLVGVAKAFLSDRNCDFSFPPICTINGQTLHNHYHGNTMKNGDMLLMDCGARLNNGYSGDMENLQPVSLIFTLL
jgi:Xaa-Pro aminopeptidase